MSEIMGMATSEGTSAGWKRDLRGGRGLTAGISAVCDALGCVNGGVAGGVAGSGAGSGSGSGAGSDAGGGIGGSVGGGVGVRDVISSAEWRGAGRCRHRAGRDRPPTLRENEDGSPPCGGEAIGHGERDRGRVLAVWGGRRPATKLGVGEGVCVATVPSVDPAASAEMGSKPVAPQPTPSGRPSGTASSCALGRLSSLFLCEVASKALVKTSYTTPQARHRYHGWSIEPAPRPHNRGDRESRAICGTTCVRRLCVTPGSVE